MNKIKIINNPSSGAQTNKAQIDLLCSRLLDGGYTVNKFNTKGEKDAYNEAIKACKEDWDMIIVCGGDGTVNEVANGIATMDSDIVLGIFSTGTVNDFGNYLNLPNDIDEFYEVIKKGITKKIDLGLASDRYFINVAACGNIANVGHNTDKSLKAYFGRFAYIIQGVKEVPKTITEPMKISYEKKGKMITEDVLIFFVSNSPSIGGFTKLAPEAAIDDGLLDVVIIKKGDRVVDIAKLFMKILTGEHIQQNEVEYFQTKEIEFLSDEKISVDIDGEFAGYLPKKFKIEKEKLNVLIKE